MSDSLYDILGVSPTSSFEQLRAAYRQAAKEVHPDALEVGSSQNGVGCTVTITMADLNEAWRVLSNAESRTKYDASTNLGSPVVSHARASPQSKTVDSRGYSRRDAWVAGVRSQIVRLSSLAGRSATQTLLVRSNRAPRVAYEPLVAQIVEALTRDTEARIRAARAAGAAPLDLGVAATLVGLRSFGDQLRRQATLEMTADLQMTAELVDRMWDILAHELAKPLTDGLGGNPHVASALRQ